MEDKKSLSFTDERANVEGKASLLAAVDYYVSMRSDISISASPGNMHNALVRTHSNCLQNRPSFPCDTMNQIIRNREWPVIKLYI